MAFELAKQAAAARAVSLVEDRMRLGLGTGSTSEAMMHALSERIQTEGLQVVGVPTSDAIAALARSLKIPILEGYPDFGGLDLCLDGADEFDPAGGLIKGGGGALLREKLVASAGVRFVVMVDPSKEVEILGSTRPVPIEVIPFGWSRVRERVQLLGGLVEIRAVHGKPFLSDHGNYIFDCTFGPIADAATLHQELKAVTGVVETGLFLGLTSSIVIGHEDGTTEVR
jgi:ribose 5-phosphate isomerase A